MTMVHAVLAAARRRCADAWPRIIPRSGRVRKTGATTDCAGRSSPDRRPPGRRRIAAIACGPPSSFQLRSRLMISSRACGGVVAAARPLSASARSSGPDDRGLGVDARREIGEVADGGRLFARSHARAPQRRWPVGNAPPVRFRATDSGPLEVVRKRASASQDRPSAGESAGIFGEERRDSAAPRRRRREQRLASASRRSTSPSGPTRRSMKPCTSLSGSAPMKPSTGWPSGRR